MTEEHVQQLLELLKELSENGGTGTQEQVSKFIINYIHVLLEKEKSLA